MADLAALTAAVEAGNRVAAADLTQPAVDEGLDPREILAAMTAAMDEVGRKFQDGAAPDGSPGREPLGQVAPLDPGPAIQSIASTIRRRGVDLGRSAPALGVGAVDDRTHARHAQARQ